jgi:hypothetical protein
VAQVGTTCVRSTGKLPCAFKFSQNVDANSTA